MNLNLGKDRIKLVFKIKDKIILLQFPKKSQCIITRSGSSWDMDAFLNINP